ncbi:MAG: DNA-binding response regulator [Stygiobacter sp.]|nr:MAG: DNA-binding response regulator [Stygiobacter sp.]
MEKKKILVIEDDKKLLNNIQKFLEEMDFIVNTASNGENGIRIVKEWKPDIIICDISIPIKDGYEVLQELSKDKQTKAIPFIFLTAKVEKEDFRKGMVLGADDYISKPFDLDDLLTSINLRLEKVNRWNTKEVVENKTTSEGPYKIEDKILINFGKKMEFCLLKELKYIKTAYPYTLLKFCSGKNALLRKSLDEWENKLPSDYFIRIHQSSIINTEYVTKIEKISKSSYLIRISDEAEPFIVSRRYSDRIKRRLP